jgi:hypothetical protein
MPAHTDQAERSSFRDPAGLVLWRDGVVLRRVNEAGRADYEALMGSGLYEDLVQRGLLIKHAEETPQTARHICTTRNGAVCLVPLRMGVFGAQDAALATPKPSSER